MNKKLVIGVVIILVIIAIVVFAGGEKNMDTAMKDMSSEESMMSEKDMDTMMDDKDMENKMDDSMTKDMMVGSYESYTPEKLARAESGDVVLFFHASWCPSCRGLDADIKKNMSEIPENVSILQVDYDAETELKKKYGVTTQHTLVQVDAQGNMITKWSGGGSLENLLSKIQ